MAQLTTTQYDALERAVARGTRLVLRRRGSELVVVPTQLVVRDGREAIEARNPTTGDRLTVLLDDIDAIEAV